MVWPTLRNHWTENEMPFGRDTRISEVTLYYNGIFRPPTEMGDLGVETPVLSDAAYR